MSNIAKQLAKLEDEINELQYQQAELIRSVWPEYNAWEYKVPLFWECEESPIGSCVYDSLEDPAWDDCIFCGHPHERK